MATLILAAISGGLRRAGLQRLLPAVLPVVLATGCYTLGVENSWIRVQNLGTEPANIEARYFDSNGNLVTSDACPEAGVCSAIPPGGGWTFSTTDNPALPNGFLGSTVIVSDQPVAALVARDVAEANGLFRTAGDTVALRSASDRLFLPLVVNREGPAQDWNSRFTIQNMGDQTACVTLTYLSNQADTEVHWDPYNPRAPDSAPKAECPYGGTPVPPRGSVFRTWFSMGVGPNFTGSVRVDLHRNAQGVPASRQQVVATADVWNSNSKHFASYRALNTGDLGTSLLLPLVEREAAYQWSTDFAIVNRDPSRPAAVRLRFEGWDGSTNPPRFVVKENVFTVQASRVCFQNLDWANCLAPGDTLPRNFYDGIARVTSSQPVGIVVARTSNRSEAYVNYTAPRAETAARRIYLPLVNKNSPTSQSRTGWNSWIRVLVVDGGLANVTVRYLGAGLPGGEVSYTTSVSRTTNIVQPWDQVLPDGFTGSAVLESDRPIVALGYVIAGTFPGDPEFMYNGIAAP